MINAHNAYNSTDVLTAQKTKLILMMYDGAIRFAEEGIRRIRTKDIEGRGVFLGKAQDIILELLNTLDKEKGGEIANNLSRLYLYVNRNLSRGIAQGEEKFVSDSITVLSELRKGWREIVRNSASEIAKSPKNIQKIRPETTTTGMGITIQA